jgi:hypothetical protein
MHDLRNFLPHSHGPFTSPIPPAAILCCWSPSDRIRPPPSTLCTLGKKHRRWTRNFVFQDLTSHWPNMFYSGVFSVLSLCNINVGASILQQTFRSPFAPSNAHEVTGWPSLIFFNSVYSAGRYSCRLVDYSTNLSSSEVLLSAPGPSDSQNHQQWPQDTYCWRCRHSSPRRRNKAISIRSSTSMEM